MLIELVTPVNELFVDPVRNGVSGFSDGIKSSGNTFHHLLGRLFRSVKIDGQMV
jgi:hypothetical protein